MMMRHTGHSILLLLCVGVTGCGDSLPGSKSAYSDVGDDGIIFKDEVVSNVPLESKLNDLKFIKPDGQEQSLSDLFTRDHLILVITRGYAGSICPYCSSQTSRLIHNYQKFADRNAEVVVVYPLEKPADTPRLDEFLKAVQERTTPPVQKVPFPVLLDVELKAVDHLGIRASLSRPATYILDKSGQIRFAYVGATLADRPSVKALLDQLDQLNAEGAGE
ncbi:MAG: peroxiredoxin family protein [Planctomycetaceae bacterium]